MNLHHVTLLVTLHLLHSHAQFPSMAYPHPMPMGMPAMSMPGMSMPAMPMQMPIMGPPRIPAVVMPYHSQTADEFRKPKKPRKRRPRRYESDSYSSSDSESSESSSSDETVFRSAKDGHKNKKRRQVLTPVVSYVTKDGYVVYQKKIKKDRAKDWLDLGKNSGPSDVQDEKDEEFEDKLREKMAKMKKRISKSKRKRHHD